MKVFRKKILDGLPMIDECDNRNITKMMEIWNRVRKALGKREAVDQEEILEENHELGSS